MSGTAVSLIDKCELHSIPSDIPLPSVPPGAPLSPGASAPHPPLPSLSLSFSLSSSSAPAPRHSHALHDPPLPPAPLCSASAPATAFGSTSAASELPSAVCRPSLRQRQGPALPRAWKPWMRDASAAGGECHATGGGTRRRLGRAKRNESQSGPDRVAGSYTRLPCV